MRAKKPPRQPLTPGGSSTAARLREGLLECKPAPGRASDDPALRAAKTLPISERARSGARVATVGCWRNPSCVMAITDTLGLFELAVSTTRSTGASHASIGDSRDNRAGRTYRRIAEHGKYTSLGARGPATFGAGRQFPRAHGRLQDVPRAKGAG